MAIGGSSSRNTEKVPIYMIRKLNNPGKDPWEGEKPFGVSYTGVADWGASTINDYMGGIPTGYQVKTDDVKMIVGSKTDFYSNIILIQHPKQKPIIDFFNKLIKSESDPTERKDLYIILYLICALTKTSSDKIKKHLTPIFVSLTTKLTSNAEFSKNDLKTFIMLNFKDITDTGGSINQFAMMLRRLHDSQDAIHKSHKKTCQSLELPKKLKQCL